MYWYFYSAHSFISIYIYVYCIYIYLQSHYLRLDELTKKNILMPSQGYILCIIPYGGEKGGG